MYVYIYICMFNKIFQSTAKGQNERKLFIDLYRKDGDRRKREKVGVNWASHQFLNCRSALSIHCSSYQPQAKYITPIFFEFFFLTNTYLKFILSSIQTENWRHDDSTRTRSQKGCMAIFADDQEIQRGGEFAMYATKIYIHTPI